MIEPFRQGPELIKEILETHPFPWVAGDLVVGAERVSDQD